MKHQRILTSTILALALLSAMPCALAQSGVPGSMSYQGRISDANGNLVGSPNPVNRTVIFRVWDSPSAIAPENLLYSEQQVVTIANGEFNVLVGQGAQVGTGTELEPKPDFDSVFNGAQRFLGVTVDDGTVAADPEITPRQQLVTSAFAFRAKTAEGVPNNAITSSMLAAGAVTPNSIAPNAIDSSKLATGGVTTASIANNAIDSSKLAPGAVLASIAANSIDSSKLAPGAVTTASIAASAIDSSKLAAGAVTSGTIAASAIDSSKLAAGAVTSAAIANNAIDSSKIADGSVTGADLANGIVTSAKLETSVSNSLWGLNGVNAFRYNRVGIGTTDPLDALHIAGGILRLDNGATRWIRMYRSERGLIIDGSSMFIGGGFAQIQWDGDGNWDVLSDRTLKKDITDAEPVLDRLMQLPVRRYHWKDRSADQPKSFGVIAQEVQPLFPDVVGATRLEENTKDALTVKYGAFGLIAAKAVQELKQEKDAELETLRDRLAALEAEAKTRDAKLEALEKLVLSIKPPAIRTVSLKAGE